MRHRWFAAITLSIVTLVGFPAAAVALTATTTTIVASPTTTTIGSAVTLTATASVSGTITFTVDGVVVGSATAGATSAAASPTPLYLGCQSCVSSVNHVTFDASGNEYIAMGSGGGRYVSSGGSIASFASVVSPFGIAVSSTGVVYESNNSTTVYKRTAYNAAASTFVNSGLTTACGLTVDGSDNLYIADKTASGKIVKVTPAGVTSTYATGLTNPCGIVMNKSTGTLYAYATGGIYSIPSGGGSPTLLASVTCSANTGLAIDDVGYLYARGCPNYINQISPSGTVRAYLTSVTTGANTTPGQNSPNDIGWYGGKVYIGGYSIDGMDRWAFNPSGFSATATYTPATAGVKSASATLAPTNSGSFAGSSASTNVTVTPAAPSAPDLVAASDLGSSNTDNVTSDATPAIGVPGTYADGTTLAITATKAGSTNVTCSYITPATSCDLGTLASGTWSITATQTVGGATSAASGALSITIDTTAPGAPTGVDLAAASDSGTSSTDNVTNVRTPTLSATGVTPAAGEVVTLTATTTGSSPVSCTYTSPATSCQLPTLSDGAWSVVATLTDAAGNVSGASTPLALTVDGSAPSGQTPDLVAASDTGTSSSDDVTNDTTPTISIPGQATGDAVTVTATPRGGGTPVTCSYVVSGGTTGCTLGTLTDGMWDVTASITDPAGNSASTPALPLTIDTTAPSAPAAPDLVAASDTGTSATDDLTADTTPTIAIANPTIGDTYTITATPQGGGSPVTCTFVASATVTGCDLGPLAGGLWNVTVRQSDPAGNQSSPSPALPLTIDTTAPGAPGAPDLAAVSDTGTSATDDLTSDSTPRIDVPGGAPGDTITVTATPQGGGAAVSCTFVVGQATGCDLPALADGTWAISATAGDPAGNASTATGGLSVSVDATPPVGPAAPALDAASDTGISSSDGITADTTPTMRVPGVPAGETITLTATGPNGQTATCSFVASATVDACDLGPLADGAWSVTAASDAVDAAGNRAAPSSPTSLLVNATPPAAPGTPRPTGAVDADSKGIPQTMDQTPAISAAGATAPNTVTLTAIGPGGMIATCSYTAGPTTSSCVLGPLADGLWTITATQTNVAGATSPAGPPYTIRIGTEPAPNLPPDPYKVDVAKTTDGHTATAWFAVPVDPATVDAVVFTIRDRNGTIIRRITKPVTGSADHVRIRIDRLPRGATVSAYTINKHGTSPRAPKHANVRHLDTRRNRTMLPNGGYRLLGAPLGDPVLFAGGSDLLTDDGRATLDRVARIARTKGGQLYVTGFARRNGINGDGWLLRLSKRRALTVATYLADRGVTGWINWNGVGARTPYVGTPGDRSVEIRWASVR